MGRSTRDLEKAEIIFLNRLWKQSFLGSRNIGGWCVHERGILFQFTYKMTCFHLLFFLKEFFFCKTFFSSQVVVVRKTWGKAKKMPVLFLIPSVIIFFNFIIPRVHSLFLNCNFSSSFQTNYIGPVVLVFSSAHWTGNGRWTFIK